ncbi:Fe3+-hydroxamate ABC transporter [Lachnoclostridium sp. An131]|uniref:ABC transporter substrate-binding protein n=1 Tax=Lachnoclostridium sp. An131 TaxID=1965555 RepID=UPI000B369BE4|nr:ABC transporter substrate-binding protein [Lachnoclostridium sp. An131]OUQ27813.1 Fe3+-hydroxamate ABC transporter [Lachnoclostridium sp. An131]
MKKILSLLLALSMALSLAACSPNQPETENGVAASEETAAEETAEETSEEANDAEAAASETDSAADTAAEVVYPVTVTDQAGREVAIEEEPQKLVSGYYISTSLLIALDLDEKLVGIEAKADTRSIYHLSAPELLELPSVGTAKEFDLEGCAALEPDLVILPMSLQDTAGTLEELGIQALVVNPEDQELLSEMISLIGTATNTKDRAQSLLDFTSEQEARLAEALADVETPSVYLAGNSSLLSTAGDAMYQSDMIRMAGGVNAAAEITDTYWAEISYEQLLAWDPEYIVLASDADYTVDDVLADQNLAECTAVVNGNVYQIPGDAEAWDSPVPSGILGAVWLSSVLHPEECPEADSAAVIDEYYETFYGFTYSEN